MKTLENITLQYLAFVMHGNTEMATKNIDKVKKSWSEVNKIRKEQNKKKREQNLAKKALKTSVTGNLQNAKITPEQTFSRNADDIISANNTLSIAVPGSILENAQSPELRAYLAGQIARAACIFLVDEIIVFDDYSEEGNTETSTIEHETGLVIARKSCVQLCRILQYLECPQYLRKHLFPIHSDLKHCGILNPLQAPHHLAQKDVSLYREGVVTNKPVKNNKGSYVNIGLLKDVLVDKVLAPGLRCTVKLEHTENVSKKFKGKIVSPSTPTLEIGTYWGYSVRIASSISKVFSQCSFKGGYDVMIGTSDKGSSVDDFECPTYKHMIIVFGGLQGLEAAIESDPLLDTEDPNLLFDFYLNTLPYQGSKTIRTEEAILVTLASLRPKLNKFKNQYK